MDSDIRAAVEAARHREQQRAAGEPLGCPCCGGEAAESNDEKKCLSLRCPFVIKTDKHLWNTRPAQEQADRALIALYDQMKADEGVQDGKE